MRVSGSTSGGHRRAGRVVPPMLTAASRKIGRAEPSGGLRAGSLDRRRDRPSAARPLQPHDAAHAAANVPGGVVVAHSNGAPRSRSIGASRSAEWRIGGFETARERPHVSWKVADPGAQPAESPGRNESRARPGERSSASKTEVPGGNRAPLGPRPRRRRIRRRDDLVHAHTAPTRAGAAERRAGSTATGSGVVGTSDRRQPAPAFGRARRERPRSSYHADAARWESTPLSAAHAAPRGPRQDCMRRPGRVGKRVFEGRRADASAS